MNDPEIMNINSDLINIYLVGTNKRSAALLGPHFIMENHVFLEEYFKTIKEKYPDIIIKKDPFSSRYFISKIKIKIVETNADIGRILDMFFHDDPNFSNVLVDRISGHIYYENICVYSEVGEYKPELIEDFEKSLIDKCQKWGGQFRYELEFVSSYLTLYDKWVKKDLKYITERKEEYKNLLYNSENDCQELIDQYINEKGSDEKIYLLVKEIILTECTN